MRASVPITLALFALLVAALLVAGASRARAQGGAVVPGDVGTSATTPTPTTPPHTRAPVLPPNSAETQRTESGEVVGAAVDTATEPPSDDASRPLEGGASPEGNGDVEADGEDEDLDGDGASGEDVVATLGEVVGAGAEPLEVEPRHRIVWREDWPRYSFDEAVLSLGLGALLLAAELLPTATTSANWSGGNVFDSPVREALRLNSHESRDAARVASEVVQWVLIASPFLVDALGAAGIGDGNWDAAFQMGLIALESYVISLVLWKVTVLLARRERPVATACREGLDAPHCNDDLETTSFFSNEAMNAFTGASLVCLHHVHMPLFGDEAADASACVVGMTAASMVGLLRVMSDFEYLSDVLVGALVGFVSGYLVPWLVHYQGGARPELRPPVALIPAPMVGPDGETYGAQIAGWF